MATMGAGSPTRGPLKQDFPLGVLRARPERGFTYVGVLLLIAVLGIGLASVGTVWSTAAQREREAELLFVGEQYRAALASYLERSPEAARTFPKALQDLLDDRRSGRTVRHLRRLYVDPMTLRDDWILVRDGQGRITGLHSRSQGRPLRRAGFGDDQDVFAEAITYADWVFAPSGAASVALATRPGPPLKPPGSTLLDANPAPGLPTTPDPKVVEEEIAKLKEACDSDRVVDLRTCEDAVARLGPEAKARCDASAQERYGVCAAGKGQAPPPLYDGTALREGERR